MILFNNLGLFFNLGLFLIAPMGNKLGFFVLSNRLKAPIQIFQLLDQNSYIKIYEIAFDSHLANDAINSLHKDIECPSIKFTEFDTKGKSVSHLYYDEELPKSISAGKGSICETDWVLPEANFSNRNQDARIYVEKLEFCLKKNDNDTFGGIIECKLRYKTWGKVNTFSYIPQ